MAKGYGVVIQPADCQGAIFADKWMGTAYQFYGVKECTEPASALDHKSFVRRMFSDASAGATQFFTYEFPQHADDIHKYVQLITGKAGDTQVAVYCPTTLYRLGGDLQPTIQASRSLRDLCDFDVLDEALIEDGALTTQRYKALLIFQADIVDQPILDKLAVFQKAGGKLIVIGDTVIKNVEDEPWDGISQVEHVEKTPNSKTWLENLSQKLAGLSGVDGKLDGVWTTRRGQQIFALNTGDKPAVVQIDGQPIEIGPSEIYFTPNEKANQ
jgi:hypothetical protein